MHHPAISYCFNVKAPHCQNVLARSPSVHIDRSYYFNKIMTKSCYTKHENIP